jgi:hypothetical protein
MCATRGSERTISKSEKTCSDLVNEFFNQILITKKQKSASLTTRAKIVCCESHLNF